MGLFSKRLNEEFIITNRDGDDEDRVLRPAPDPQPGLGSRIVKGALYHGAIIGAGIYLGTRNKDDDKNIL